MQVDTQHLLFGCTTVRDGTSVALEKNKVTKESVRGVLQAMYPQAPAAGLGNMFNMQNKVRLRNTQPPSYLRNFARIWVCLVHAWACIPTYQERARTIVTITLK